MKPEPEMEARGLKAYEQVRAFERLRTWRLQANYALGAVIPLAAGAAGCRLGHPWMLALGAGAAVFMAVRAMLDWKRLRHRHAENCELLARLEATYGDALSWVQVENHFAALEALKREIAGKADGGYGPLAK